MYIRYTFILHNINTEKLLKHRETNNCPINNQVPYLFFNFK